MHVQELLDAPVPAAPAAVYLFVPGKASARTKESTFEPFLAERAAQRLIDAYVDPSNRDFAFGLFHADETPAAYVIGEAQTIPFLAERRVILVRNAERYDTEENLKALSAYLENPAETAVLLMIAGKVDKRMRFFKSCEKAGTIVECPMLEERAAEKWVCAEASLRGYTVDAAAASALVARSGTGLSEINNALTLAIDFVGQDAKRVSEKDVVAACADVAEEVIWSLTDAIAASNTGGAVRALRNLLDLGKHPDEIIGTINWLLKTAYQLAVPETAPGVNRFVAAKTQPLADKLGRRKLPDAFALCTGTQFMMRETGVDPGLALDLLVIKLATPRAKA